MAENLSVLFEEAIDTPATIYEYYSYNYTNQTSVVAGTWEAAIDNSNVGIIW